MGNTVEVDKKIREANDIIIIQDMENNEYITNIYRLSGSKVYNKQIKENIIGIIKNYMNYKTSDYYIGRTDDPDERYKWHHNQKHHKHMKHMAILWETTPKHIKMVEYMVIENFIKNKHCKNKTLQTGGGLSNLKRQYLYIITKHTIL